MLRNFYRKALQLLAEGRERRSPTRSSSRRSRATAAAWPRWSTCCTSHGIEVGRAHGAPFKVAEGEYPAGTLRRPPRPALPQLRRRPADAAEVPADTPYEPYDDVSWALPVHYGVEVKTIDDAAMRTRAARAGQRRTASRGPRRGRRPRVPAAGHGPGGAARGAACASRASRSRSPRSRSRSAASSIRAGSWVIPAQAGLARGARTASPPSSASTSRAAAAAPDGRAPRVAAAAPRRLADLGRHASPSGWMRIDLDEQKVPYDYISDEDVRAGRPARALRRDPVREHLPRACKEQIHGIDPKFGPMPYTKTPEFPSHGVPDASDDITGGIGWGGMANLEQFVREGGVLVTLGGGSQLPLDGGLVARRAARAAGGVFTPGVELRARFSRPDHPIAYGYPEVTSAFRVELPRLRRRRRPTGGCVVLQWGTKLPKRRARGAATGDDGRRRTSRREGRGPMVVSGGIEGEDTLEGKPGDPRHPGGAGARGRLQLQPDPPRPEPLGLPAALERDPELGQPAAGCAVKVAFGQVLRPEHLFRSLAQG